MTQTAPGSEENDDSSLAVQLATANGAAWLKIAQLAEQQGEMKQAEAAYRAQQGGGGGETEDDGKMGYAERMELEEAIRLEKWKENVPMMTIEGQPLSENVKKRRDALVAYATAKAQANGGLFEDSGGPYNDAAISATPLPEGGGLLGYSARW